MSTRYQYTSIDRIFAKLSKDITDQFDEDSVIEWIGEALEFIGCVKSYEEDVYFTEVKDFKASIPKGTHAIIQIARNNEWKERTDSSSCISSVVKDCESNFDFAVIDASCSNLTLIPQFDYRVDYSVFGESNCYKSKWTPVRLKSHNFFNSLVCPENNDLYHSSRDEYTIVMGDTLRFSFSSGFIAIARLRQAVDEETGYPLVPDTVSHSTAIVTYITYMIAKREFFAGRDGAQGRMEKAEQQWHWYCKQASNIDMMPFGEDEYQNLLDQRSYLLPRNNKYYGFFGRLGQAENRTYNDPNSRNSRYGQRFI